MKALAQCWFTRAHVPDSRPYKEDDGSHTSRCRHCEREIISWDRSRWFIAGGFNVTHLAETVGGRFLFVVDTADEMVVARYPAGHLANDEALAALMEDIRVRHGIGEPGSTLELHDSGAAPAARPKPRARRAPDMTGRSRLSAQT